MTKAAVVKFIFDEVMDCNPVISTKSFNSPEFRKLGEQVSGSIDCTLLKRGFHQRCFLKIFENVSLDNFQTSLGS